MHTSAWMVESDISSYSGVHPSKSSETKSSCIQSILKGVFSKRRGSSPSRQNSSEDEALQQAIMASIKESETDHGSKDDEFLEKAMSDSLKAFAVVQGE